MKKTKIANYLKTGILLVSVSLLLWNCEKEDVSLVETTNVNFERVKKVFATQFNKSAFPRIKNEPLWEKASVHFSEDGQYIEIPFREVKQEDLEKSTSMSLDHLVATVNSSGEVELNIVHYFAQDIKSRSLNFELLNYYDTDNFHGFITKYDLNKNVIAVDRFINGIKSENKFTIKEKKKSDLLGKVDEECNVSSELIRTEDCMFWYNPDTVDDPIKKGNVEIITCSYTTSVIYYNSCGGNSGNNTSSGGGVTVITNNEFVEILNNLTGKAKCVYEKLKNSSIGFRNAIKKFDGDFPVSHLKLTVNNNLGANVYGLTLPPVNFVTEIQFNENRFSNLSDLGASATFSHEIIHAEIFRKMLSAARKGDLNTSNMNVQQAENYVTSLKDNFPGLYDYYVERWHPTWNHNMMASHYRTTIADMMQEFDSNRLPRSTYEAVAWAGLGKIENNQTTVAWSNLSSAEKLLIENLINQHFFNGPSNCN